MKNSAQSPQPNPPDVGTSTDEGGASNHSCGAALVPAAPPLSVAITPRDVRSEVEDLRDRLARQHAQASALLKLLYDAEQSEGWPNHLAVDNAVRQMKSESMDFATALLQLQLKLTFVAPIKKT